MITISLLLIGLAALVLVIGGPILAFGLAGIVILTTPVLVIVLGGGLLLAGAAAAALIAFTVFL